MSSTVYVVADLHFGHKKVAEARGFASPDEHDAELVRRWNDVVSKKDVVYVLGDVFRVERVGELNGTKKLAGGNHDTKPCAVYGSLFSKFQACFEFHGALLTHLPVHPCQLLTRWPLNVHGHMHAAEITGDPRYLCVSAERQFLRPVELRPLIEHGMRRRQEAGIR